MLAYRSPELEAYPPDARGGDAWVTARIIGIIMAYNGNVLPREQAPKAWADLLKPEFKGRKLVIQDSAAGTSFNQMYLLEKLLGADFMRRWGRQDPVIVATSAQLIDMLVRGEALVGATVDHFRAFEPDAAKAGIVGVYPTEGHAARCRSDRHLQGRSASERRAAVHGLRALGGRPEPARRRDLRRLFDAPRHTSAAGPAALAETKPLLPTDFSDYERAAQNFPETFEKYFKA